jgi:competence protein ComEA
MEPIKNWFGFSRRERRSTFILLIIVCTVIAIRYVVPEKNADFGYIGGEKINLEISAAISSSDKKKRDSLFLFNPNTASIDTLVKLGLDSRAAATLIKYRSRGGKFSIPSDIRKVYGIDSSHAEKLIPFIELENDSAISSGNNGKKSKRPPIELNGCDSALLVSLPGIGPVLASRIIKYRRLLGGYVSVSQLREVYGLPAETFDLIKGRLTVDTLSVAGININSGGYKELIRIPYLERYEVSSILKYRELQGRINGIDDLTKNKLITPDKAVKVRGYLSFD